ncbi:hypothetical protein BS47DRAFT_1376288 [Hydnum rufescens UP504]|uniref:Cation/H+ exchanger transmembrane domain-containing protein n=1 Tax=Hydnum rufescens UP504 TaxID=1448309 RepID=A0A9P6DYS0_9AGAM|nr:hypothetical protein BS47DRAFT_1376288 [Hydnum rufescens UP504]
MLSESRGTLLPLVARKAASQAGIIDGQNPSVFDPNDPIKVWVIQVGIILIFSYVLALGMSRIRQPRVCAEIIAGIILGPTAMGRIPHFSAHIFPTASLPYLNLTATIALVLYLFLIGLEIDTRVMGKNLRQSALISAAGMLLPFGLGAAVSVPIYHKFVDHELVTFGHFLLFTCVAVSITAFPVLCRILTELKLLDTTVGVVVLAAGVGNDVVGWILLALTVALVNATSGLSALWVLLTAIAWVLFMLIAVRRAIYWLAKRTGSLETGVPTPLMMTLTLLTVFASAFFTDVIGIHPIFGGFLAGLCMPHEGGFAIALVEKIEDLVTILLLPIYFTLSGLKTDLGTLNTGLAWGYAFIGCTVTARLTGFDLRESGAIGALMTGILNTRLFSMFVLMALVLTLTTTPLSLWIYPPRVQKLHEGAVAKLEPISGSDGNSPEPHEKSDISSAVTGGHPEHVKTRFTVTLDQIEHLPAIMTVVQFLRPPLSRAVPAADGNVVVRPTPKISIEALRLIELTERTSAVMRGSDTEELLHRDPLLNVFTMFSRLNRIAVSPSLSVVPHSNFASSCGPATHSAAPTPVPHSSYNPFAALFGQALSSPSSTHTPASVDSSVLHSQFIRQVFSETSCDVALFVDRGLAAVVECPSVDSQHIFLPFFGGPDDRLALGIVVQLCAQNPAIKPEWDLNTRDSLHAEKPQTNFTVTSAVNFPDTVYGNATTETRLNSQTADHIAWAKCSTTFTSPRPLRAAVNHLNNIAPAHKSKSIWVITGRSRRLAVDSHQADLRQYAQELGASSPGEMRKTIGDPASAFVIGTNHQLLVFQAHQKFAEV